MERVISFVGLFVMIGLAWLMSSNKRKFPWRVVIGGLILQFIFAAIMFASRDAEKTQAAPAAAVEERTEEVVAAADESSAKAVGEAGPPEETADEAQADAALADDATADDGQGEAPGAVVEVEEEGRGLLRRVDDGFNALIDCVDAGSEFVFGANFKDHFFAFRVLPSIIFFAALMQALYYMGVMQQIVRGLGFVVQRTLGTTGPESLAAAANIFLGQTEAPLVVKPYVNAMTKSELMAIMVPGFGSTAGGVLIAYKLMGVDAGHLLTASLLSAPASLLIAKVMVPETERSKTATNERVNLDMGDSGANLLEAVSIGTIEGLKLALNVGAMLIAFLALIAMCDGILGWLGHTVYDIGEWMGWLQKGFTFEWSFAAILSVIFSPFAWIMGIPREDCMNAGRLLGEKMVANEFVAYQRLHDWMQPGSGVELSQRTITILTYALCGFANFSSIGIQIGGIGGMCPGRQRDLAKLGFRAMLGGALANFMTACIAGMML
jgi:CNT family concentrative nucleoside transporter